jgi:alkylation response protein AidB-like acyl-CoA dehydrogenase
LRNGRPFAEDPLFAARLADVEIELMALEILNLRVLSEARARGAPGPMASMLKIRGSEIIQRIAELIVEMQGSSALATRSNGRLAPEPAMYLNLRKTTIYGGSNEIQRGIIAKHVLEL